MTKSIISCIMLVLFVPVLGANADPQAAKNCKILLTDDDGVMSPGLLAAYRGLSDMCDLVISAPSVDRSGASHSMMNTNGRITVKKVTLAPGITAYAVDGSPAEAAAVGVLGLHGDKPFDLVISGINAGSNTGTTNLYSGTVNAAMEAEVRGVPGIAISAAHEQLKDYVFAVAVTREIVRDVLQKGLPKGTMLNVNIPDPPVKGVEIARSFGEVYEVDGFDTTVTGPDTFLYKVRIKPLTVPPNTGDTAAFQAGMITVTPLKLDRTDYESIDALKDWKLAVPAP